MREQYHPNDIEQRAQKHWDETHAYEVTEYAKNADGSLKPKFYACPMLPYPSGKCHMGHVRNYTINDMMSRQKRMQGYNVLYPMGWDAFGMPAENAAIKSKVPPAKWTYENIAYMRNQLKSMGFSIDWKREMAACDPDYYRWNQWFFLKMLEKGIAYRKTQVVNWDPVDQTVLANEQVVDGRGWRSGALVEKREIPGYYLRITDYADELLDFVKNKLPGWPERLQLMQENWIGRSEGVRFAFTHNIKNAEGELIDDGRLYVFTTRIDTVMGVSYCAVAAEHPIATEAARHNPELAVFIEACKLGGTTEAELATKEKEGMPTGFTVTHPLTGQEVPLWVANYVLMSYGDGAVMAVPAHDARDFEFATKYELPIKQVIDVPGVAFDATQWQDAYANKVDGRLVESGEFSGLTSPEAVDKIAEKLKSMGLGEKQTTFRLRDWGISRQRYWGTPIPMIHCECCGAVPVPEKDLPVRLPEDLVPDGTGNPLNKCEEFLRVDCPQCGKPARRETDTMDTFIDSSWYYLRYCCPGSENGMIDERAAYWMPMDQYIGGIEHACMHLLYARFWSKVMRDMGMVSFDEPFTNLFCQGMVLNHIYSRRTDKGGIEYFWPHEVENITNDKGAIVGAKLLSTGETIDYGGVGTMSKSKNNGIDPSALAESQGADTVRLFVVFASPPEQTLEWSDSGVEGASRFLRRLWTLCFKSQERIARGLEAGRAHLLGESAFAFNDKECKGLRHTAYSVLKQADYDYDRLQYNTVVSAGMKLLNLLEEDKLPEGAEADVAFAEVLSILIRLLYPVVPHITWQLWQDLGYSALFGDLLDAAWPKVDEAALVLDEIELMLQVNGKLRGSVVVASSADKATIEAAARQHPAVEKFLEGREPKRVIVVPGRLVNVVG